MDEVLLKEIKDLGAILEGHFIGTSGKHLSTYIAKDKILPHTDLTSRICKRLAEMSVEWQPEVVLGPTTGGIALAQWTAHHLSALSGREVLAVYSDSVNKTQTLRKRGYDAVVESKSVLIVEDTVNTAKSILEVVDAAREAGASVVGAVSIFNRNTDDEMVAAQLGCFYRSLFLMPLEAYAEEEVPEWLKKIPVNTEIAHGREYVHAQKDN